MFIATMGKATLRADEREDGLIVVRSWKEVKHFFVLKILRSTSATYKKL